MKPYGKRALKTCPCCDDFVKQTKIVGAHKRRGTDNWKAGFRSIKKSERQAAKRQINLDMIEIHV